MHESTPDGAPPPVHASGHTDRGNVRSLNEDAYLSSYPVFAVADGMGGHAHGDRASAAAIGVLGRQLAGAARISPQDVLDALELANREVRAIAHAPGDGRGASGTTLTGVAFVHTTAAAAGHWMAFNVGDSRIYRWDGRHLTQLSVDHSVVQELVDAGRISRLDAARHPSRNVVTRALGASDEVDPDVWMLPAGGHQTFVICSDGLTKELVDDEIARVIVFHSIQEAEVDEHPRSLAERLVGAAVAAGGVDNVTVVVVESGLPSEPALVDATGDRDALPSFLEETMPRGRA